MAGLAACRACSRATLDLVKLQGCDNLNPLWNCLVAMSGIKTLHSRRISAVATSKFLHFFNPRLFPIYDRKVIVHGVLPSLKRERRRSQDRWQDRVTNLKDHPFFADGLGEYLNYILFASDCFRGMDVSASMAVLAEQFVEMLRAERSDVQPPSGMNQYLATAFEFAVIGAFAKGEDPQVATG